MTVTRAFETSIVRARKLLNKIKIPGKSRDLIKSTIVSQAFLHCNIAISLFYGVSKYNFNCNFLNPNRDTTTTITNPDIPDKVDRLYNMRNVQ